MLVVLLWFGGWAGDPCLPAKRREAQQGNREKKRCTAETGYINSLFSADVLESVTSSATECMNRCLAQDTKFCDQNTQSPRNHQ
eukprot:3289096-Amphidinium_carterae.1